MSVAVETPIFQKLTQLDSEIQQAQEQCRRVVDAKEAEIRKLLSEIGPRYGVKSETKAAAPETRPTASAAPQKNGAHKQRKAATASGRKPQAVKPKYRDPADPQKNTWAGRGLPPRWLKEYEAAGRKRDEFRV